MSKTKAATAARRPSVQEHAVAPLPDSPTSEKVFKTLWQGGNPFDRVEFSPKQDKVGRR
ncbi:hypothetical protein [Pseudorhodoferax sp.]|uniref:hypothetical protein n=1 Tax=Pseudorhodoferax sp. TaxID=1993553 RepID=UPI002DD66B29|nr:hypothetical protein [Pseudorhodoferax sp.]